jgi:hypothetical protein
VCPDTHPVALPELDSSTFMLPDRNRGRSPVDSTDHGGETVTSTSSRAGMGRPSASVLSSENYGVRAAIASWTG